MINEDVIIIGAGSTGFGARYYLVKKGEKGLTEVIVNNQMNLPTIMTPRESTGMNSEKSPCKWAVR